MKIDATDYRYEDYLESCLYFAAETYHWDEMPRGQQYKSNGRGGYYETCDGAEGFLPVEWAFHCTQPEVRMEAFSRWMEAIHFDIEVRIDSVAYDQYEDMDDLNNERNFISALLKLVREEIKGKMESAK